MVTASAALWLAAPLPPPSPPPHAARDVTAAAAAIATPVRVNRFIWIWLLCPEAARGRGRPVDDSSRLGRQGWETGRCGVRHNADQWKTSVVWASPVPKWTGSGERDTGRC